MGERSECKLIQEYEERVATVDSPCSDSENVYEVEAIREKRVARDGSIEYLIIWKGYPEDDCSWESAENANCPFLVKAFEERTTPSNAQESFVSMMRSTNVCQPTNNFQREEDLEYEDENEESKKSTEEVSAPLRQPRVADGAVPNRRVHESRKTGSKKHIPIPLGLERTFIGTKVAFSPATDKWMSHKDYSQVGSIYLVGVVRDYKYVAKEGKYEIRWLNSFYQNHVAGVDLMTVIQGRENFEKIHSIGETPRWTHLLRSTKGNTLQLADDLEDLVDYEFADRQDVPATLAEVEKVLDVRFDPEQTQRVPRDLYSHADDSRLTRVKPEYKHIFLHSASASFFAYMPLSFWRQVLSETNAQLADTVATETMTVSSSSPKRVVRKISPFTLDELMKFLGILWFMTMINKGEYANYWGEQVEDVIFDTRRVDLDSIMSLRRFRDLRSAFSCRRSSRVTPADLRRDSAVRIPQILNILKQTAPKSVDVGRDLAVDEATIAARSKFARHLIAFNPRKPTGKYHFKLYMTCCSTSWISLSFRLHGESTLQDRTEGVVDQGSTSILEKEMEVSAATRQIVLEITRPFYNSVRIVNCDNYYTSVQFLQALRIKGLYCRGTVRRTSKHFPRHIILTDPSPAEKNSNKSKGKRAARMTADMGDSNQASQVESSEHAESVVTEGNSEQPGLNELADEQPDTITVNHAHEGTSDGSIVNQSTHTNGEVQRGDILQAVSNEHQMLAASWCDGNVVTIVSNADPSTMTKVKRVVRGTDIEVPAPTCIKEYNTNMQGVDRNDQFRARFSTANGHSFNKWHKKLAFAIIDIARVNAFLTRKLSTDDALPDRDAHRTFMVELIQELFSGKWKDTPDDDTMLFGGQDSDDSSNTGVLQRRASPTGRGMSPSALSPRSIPFSGACPDRDSAQVFQDKRRKRMCIICRFEGRRDTLSTVHCLRHKVSLCKRSYPSTNIFGCQNSDWSCWDKFHLWYLLRNVFSENGCVNRSSAVYREKRLVDAEEDPEASTASRALSSDQSEAAAPVTAAQSVALSTPSWINTPTPSIEY